MMIRSIFIFTLLLHTVVYCDLGCLNHEGVMIEWWVVLKVPASINKTGYGYIDSRSADSKFTIYANPCDSEFTPLWRTLQQINGQPTQVLAWNDEWPNGNTSSTSAHSKAVIAVSKSFPNGFLLDHSIPKYPDFPNGKVNTTIATG